MKDKSPLFLCFLWYLTKRVDDVCLTIGGYGLPTVQHALHAPGTEQNTKVNFQLARRAVGQMAVPLLLANVQVLVEYALGDEPRDNKVHRGRGQGCMLMLHC